MIKISLIKFNGDILEKSLLNFYIMTLSILHLSNNWIFSSILFKSLKSKSGDKIDLGWGQKVKIKVFALFSEAIFFKSLNKNLWPKWHPSKVPTVAKIFDADLKLSAEKNFFNS